MVSETPTDGRCNAEVGDGYCEGWQMDNGRCYSHGGRNEDDDRDAGGAPKNNDNAARHELYAAENTYYNRRSEAQRAIIDSIYEEYEQRYRQRHGDPVAGDVAMLFKVAISIHKLLKADDWEADRPSELDSGHLLIDRSERRTSNGDRYHEYGKAAVLQAEKQLEGFVRRWLKDNDLLAPADDGADMEVNVTGALWENLTEYYEEGD